MSDTVTFDTEVTHVVLETMDVLTYRLALPQNSGFSFQAGQFINLTVDTPEYGEEMARLTRAYSISSAPSEGDFIDLTVKYYDDGHVSKHLREVTYVGEVMTVSGPHGHFFYQPERGSRIALIGGGAGVAPMRGIIADIIDRKLEADIQYLASCRTSDDQIYLATLYGWTAQHPQLSVTHTVTRPDGRSWPGRTGRIDAKMLTEVCPPESTDQYFIAGPTDMVKATKRILKEELGVDKSRIIWEPWG